MCCPHGRILGTCNHSYSGLMIFVAFFTDIASVFHDGRHIFMAIYEHLFNRMHLLMSIILITHISILYSHRR